MMMIALTHVFCSFSQLPSSLSFPSASFVKPLVGPIKKKKVERSKGLGLRPSQAMVLFLGQKVNFHNPPLHCFLKGG